MASMTFQINDASTSAGVPAVWVTITENTDGTLSFSVTQEGGIIGDLRGLFFDVADESILGSLKVTSDSTDVRIGNDNITNLGDGANMQGLTGDDKGYDVGIEVGTSGIGKDDYSSYEFTLGSTARPLTLADFSNVNFGVRLTSVGTIDGSRADSSKIMETTFTAMNAQDDTASVDENNAASGNVLANDDTNDTASGSLSVTGWEGGDLGAAVELADTEGATLQLNADGSYVLDASASDALSAGESITRTFTYNTLQQVDGDSATDQATFTVTVNGVNDGPLANDDEGGRVTEDAVLSGVVTANDSDIDRLDTHTWSLESFDGQGSLTFNEDGTWSYDADGAYDDLNEGESVELSFQYQMTDNHGASDLATVRFTVDGVGSVEPPPPPPPATDSYPDFVKDISHATLVFSAEGMAAGADANNDGYYSVKIDEWEGSDDLDTDLAAIIAWLVENDPNITEATELLGAQLKGGNVGTADGSYDDFWANDSDDSVDVVVVAIKQNGSEITEVRSTDAEPTGLDLEQNGTLNGSDVSYDYDHVIA